MNLSEILINILDIIYFILDVIIICYALYYFITGIYAFVKKDNNKKFNKKFKFAIIVPARNEEDVISELILSLKKQKYNKKYYDIFVFANNCSDNTEKVATSSGAKVICCPNNIKNKGDTLRYAFSFLNTMEYNAYIIFDADNIVHPEFLKRINDSLCLGYDVVQGYRESKNPCDNWISSSYTLFYLVQNYFFNRARINTGWSSSINGTGFCVTKKVIKKYGFNTETLTEDIEYAAICSLNDVKIYFEEKAITYDEQPTDFSISWKQRKRWSSGTIACMRKYFLKLTKKAIVEHKFRCFDMALFFVAPIIQILTFFVMISYMFFNIVQDGIFYSKALALVYSYITCVLFSAFTLILKKKNVLKYLKGIITFPFFMLTWIPINIICLFKKSIKWEKIKHKKKIKIESIIKFD